MKNLKTKLMASIASLAIATVLMTSSSFAWFTISTAPEIKGISTRVAANGNLEIALASDGSGTAPSASGTADTGKNTAWGNLVDVTAYFTAHTTDSLKPIAIEETCSTDADGESFFSFDAKAPNFGEDGRIKEVSSLTPTFEELIDETAASAAYTDGGLFELIDASGNVWAYRIDYFVRTNVAGNLSILASDIKNQDYDRGNGVDGEGSYISGEAAELITIGFKVGDAAMVYATRGAEIEDEEGVGTGKFPLSSTTIYTFTADDTATTDVDENNLNTAVKVSMYIFVKGNDVTNADFANDEKSAAINIQFQHSAHLLDLGIDYVDPSAAE